jgi:signal transduction histidine kinase
MHKQLVRSKSKHRADYRKALTEFSRSLTLIVDFEMLLENLAGKLREIADIRKVIILLQDHETGLFSVADSRGVDKTDPIESLKFTPDDRLTRWLMVNETPLITDENPGVVEYLTESEQSILERIEIRIIVPLLVMNHVTGMVMLGRKESGDAFTREELELLTTLLSQSALAFENALLYEEQKQRLKKMFRADRLATIGQIAAGAAHEIRNPLTSIRSTIQYLKKSETSGDKVGMLGELMAEVDRIDAIIHGLLSFSKPVTPQKERVDLTTLLQQVLTLTASTARKNQVIIRFSSPEQPVLIKADPSQMKQVFINIVLNAIQGIQEKGELTIQIEPQEQRDERGENLFYRIQFIDTGIGIPEDKLELIFDPFFTTKKDGTGLGLSICYGIIQQHGGDIEVKSVHGKSPSGTTVTIMMPAGV